jgi:transposase
MARLMRAFRETPVARRTGLMQGRNSSEPSLFQMVDLEALIPPNHRLRKIDAVLDLSFVPETVAECYSPSRGRPSIDPELALRMMLLGALYDLSDRELCAEIQMHAGMRWFCRLNFHDPIPDHSTLSRLRNERWSESGLFDRLMDEVIRQCCAAGLVSGRHLSVDGTEVRADASMKSLKPRGPRRPDDEDPPTTPNGGTEEPKPAGDWKGRGECYKNETHFSTTDPDARLYRKGNQGGARLSYLAHDLIDTKSRVILRRKASLAAGSAERDTAIEMVDEVLEAHDELGLPSRPEILTGDKGYGSTELITGLLDRNIEPHIPLLADAAPEELPTWKRRTFDLEQKRARQQKLQEAKARNRVREIQKTRGYTISRKLRTRSEHTFAEGKNQHGLGRARLRGRERVQDQATLAAVVQNLKRLLAFRGRRGGCTAAAASPVALCPAFGLQNAHIRLFLARSRTIFTGLATVLAFAGLSSEPFRQPIPATTP